MAPAAMVWGMDAILSVAGHGGGTDGMDSEGGRAPRRGQLRAYAAFLLWVVNMHGAASAKPLKYS